MGGAREDGGERGGRAEAHAHAGVREAAEGNLAQLLRDARHARDTARDLRERSEPVAPQLRGGRDPQLRRIRRVSACTVRHRVTTCLRQCRFKHMYTFPLNASTHAALLVRRLARPSHLDRGK